MPKQHVHREGGRPCRFPTKKACDEAVKAFLQERKDSYERAQAQKAADRLADRNRRIDDFIEVTWKRMNDRR